MKHLSGAQLWGRLLASPTNISLGWKSLPGTNTLAYYKNPWLTDKKSFKTFAPEEAIFSLKVGPTVKRSPLAKSFKISSEHFPSKFQTNWRKKWAGGVSKCVRAVGHEPSVRGFESSRFCNLESNGSEKRTLNNLNCGQCYKYFCSHHYGFELLWPNSNKYLKRGLALQEMAFLGCLFYQ